MGLLFFLTRPPICGGCFTLQSTWHNARETVIRTVRLLHVCEKNIDFIDCCCVFCWRGRTSKKRRNRKMDFHRTRKTKKKQTKHTHRGKTSGRASAWGATAARPSVVCFHNIIFRRRANSVLGGTPQSYSEAKLNPKAKTTS